MPEGRTADELATGGCHGEAAGAVPSVWDTRRSLSADLDALRRDVAGSGETGGRPVAAAVDRFVEVHGAELDAAIRRYDGAVERIRRDEALAAYLAARAAEVG